MHILSGNIFNQLKRVLSPFPSLRQLDSMDCGATCVRIIARHYGKKLSSYNLSKMCGTSKDGVSLYAVEKVSKELGFNTLSGKFTIEQIKNEALLPCILFWNKEHYVVLYKIRKRWFNDECVFFISDPAHQKKKLTESSFIKSWLSFDRTYGIALLLEPSNKFYKNAEVDYKQNKWNDVLQYFLKNKKVLTQLFLGLLFGGIIQVSFPFFTQLIVDAGIKERDIDFIYLLLIGQVVLILSKTSFEFIRRWLLLQIGSRFSITVLSNFMHKLMQLPYLFFETKNIGDLLQRIQDHERIEKFVNSHVLSFIFSVLTFFFFSTVLLIYNRLIFYIFIIGSSIYLIWIVRFQKKRKGLDITSFEIKSRSQDKYHEILKGIQEIKLQNCEQRKRWELEDIRTELFFVHVESLKIEQSQEIGGVLLNEIKNIIITFVSAIAVINHEISLGMMLSIQYILGQLNMPIEQSVIFLHSLQDASISLERVNEVFEQNNELDGKAQFSSKGNDLGIRISNLSFSYDLDSPKALNDIHLHIPSGKTTAIVGDSGSGKTTLIKLLLKFYQPQTGIIRIGEESLANVNSKWWRDKCGVVMQDSFLFSESIARNIAISGDTINQEKLKHAGEVANIDNFINSLPLKYDTIIGENGIGLSQGQKQRILIARAIYKNPDFIFLDEATNALDSTNEKVVLNKLEDFYRGKTVIIVAHRLSTVKRADQIIVLKKGQIIEKGSHSQLMNLKGRYFNLVKDQLEVSA